MNKKESSQMHDNQFQPLQLAALVTSLITELREEKASNPEKMIMNERIRATLSELNNAVQQKEYLEIDNLNLQSFYLELVKTISTNGSLKFESAIQKYTEFFKACESKILDMGEKIGDISTHVNDIKIHNDSLENNRHRIETLNEENEILFNQLNEKTQEYRQILNQKENENIDLQNNILEYDKKINQAQKDYQEIQQKLITEINNKNLLNMELKSIKESAEREKSEYKANLEAKSTEIKNLQNQIIDCKAENKNLQDQLNNCKKRIEELQLSESNATKQLENERRLYLEQQISGENHNKELLESIESSRNQAKDELDQKDQVIKSLNEIQDNLQKEIESLKNSIKEKEELETKLKSLSDENENLKNMQANQNEKIMELSNANKELANVNRELASLNKSLTEKTQNTEEDYSLRIKEIEQKHIEENQTSEEKINGMYLDSEFKQKEIDRLSNELEQSKNINDNLTNELELLKKENEKQTTEINSLKELTKEIDQIRNSYDSNLAELEKYKEEIQTLTNSSNENLKKYEEISQVKSELEEMLKSLNEKLSEKEDELQSKSVEIDLLRSGEKNKSKLNEQLLQSNKEIKKLSSEINRLQKVENEFKEAKILLDEKANIEMKNKELAKQNEILLADHEELVSIAGYFNVEIYDLRKFFNQTTTEKVKLEKIVEENSKSINELTKELKETKEAASTQLSEYENVVENLNASHLTEIESLTNEYNQKVNQLKESNQELNEKNNNYKKEIADLNQRFNSLTESISNYQNNDEKTILEAQLNEKNEENKNLHELIQKLQEEKTAIEQSSFIEKEIHNNEEIDKLKRENQLQLEEINELKQKHQNQIEDIREQINILTLKNEEIESQNNNLEKSLEEATSENDELKNQINDTRLFLTIIGPLNGEIFDLREDLQVSADRIHQMKKDNRSLKAEVKRLNDEIIILNTSLAEKKNAVISLEQRQIELEKASNTKVTELKSGISKIFEELEDRRKHDDELVQLEQDKQLMLRDIGIFEEQIYDLIKQTNESFLQISTLKSEISGYLNMIEGMKYEANNSDQNIAYLNQQLGDANNEIERVKKVSEQMDSKIVELNETISNLNDKINSLEQSNHSLLKEKEKLSMMNQELDSRVQMTSKEKELMIQQLDKKQEVNDAIEQLRAKLDQTLEENKNYKNEISSLNDKNARLSEMLEKSELNQTVINQLEYDKLELSSRVALLQSQLQLKTAKLKDSEIAELEAKIEGLQKEADSVVVLNERIHKLELENEQIRSERNALDLKSSELEANTASREELQSALDRCAHLENEAQNRESYIESILTERNSIDLKYEQLVQESDKIKKQYEEELSSAKNRIQKIEQDYQMQKLNEEKLKKSLHESELKSTNTCIENIKEKKETTRLQIRISELESLNESLKKENEMLEDKNQSQRDELSDLSQKISNLTANKSSFQPSFSNPNTKSPYKIISDKTSEINDLKKKIRLLEAQLHSESAEHFDALKENDRQFRAIKEAERCLRNEKTDYEALAVPLANMFSCSPDISSIIAAAAKCKGESQFTQTILEKYKKLQVESANARREPNYLQQKLREANMKIDLEKKKNFIMAAKIDKGSSQFDSEKDVKNEISFSTNIGKCEICVKNFLHILIDSNESSNEIKIAASNLLSKAQISELNDLFDESLWSDLSKAIKSTICNYRLQFSRMKFRVESLNENLVQTMGTINKNVDGLKSRISILSLKSGKISFFQSKSVKMSKTESNRNDPMVSHIPRIINSSLNDRQPRKPIQSIFQKTELDSNTPRKSNWKSNATPKNIQKKQENETPFRTPFGELSNSTLNISFGTETPKITMHKNAMSKIPIHYVPSGVVPPDSRNYH